MRIEFGKYDLAKYPFLNEAREYLSMLGYDINEFDESMHKVLDRAVKRIWLALNGEILDDLADVDEEILSFFIALIMLHAIGIKSVSKRFALSEARRIEKFLIKDLATDVSIRNAILDTIFKDIFGLEVIVEDDKFKIKVDEYLKRATKFHDPYWKLINRDVHEGYVYLNPNSIVRLVRDEMSLLIYDKIEHANIKNLPDAIGSRVDELRKSIMNDKRFKPIIPYKSIRYPPCIEHILQDLYKGENIPHSARFLLATYMLGIGKSVDEVCSLFEHAPDYNESITRYQVEYLAGLRGNRKGYKCPNCEKIARDNLCYKSKECDNIISPLQFRGKKDDKNG